MTERSDTTNPKSGIQNRKFPSEVHPSLKVPRAEQSHMSFRPANGVQVREETFGLLFYNYQGPRLYFVPSKDLIDVDFFNGRQNVGALIASICARKGCSSAEIGERVRQILAQLEDKGLIDEQPIR
jgi:putative mycofactocin binding protein MftB